MRNYTAGQDRARVEHEVLESADRVGMDGDASRDIPADERWTAAGMTRRVVARFGHIVRYVPGRRAHWLVRRDGRWQYGDDAVVMELVVRTILLTAREPVGDDPRARKQRDRYVRNMQMMPAMASARAKLKRHPAIVAAADGPEAREAEATFAEERERQRQEWREQRQRQKAELDELRRRHRKGGQP